MIDFKNDSIFKLKATKGFLNQDMVLPLFVNGEQFIGSELELYFSGLGKVKFEFSGKNNVIAIGRIISDKIL